MKARRSPQLHAGSMADIAFLLLIFFLMTTVIETDQGILQKLPPEADAPEVVLRERNVLRIHLNKQDSLWCENRVIPVDSLFRIARDFIDNGGSGPAAPDHCSYCQGRRSPESSDSPMKAVVQLTHDRQTSYGFYIAVQDQLSRAYANLRDREGLRRYGKSYSEMEAVVANPLRSRQEAQSYAARLAELREYYPIRILEPASDPEH